jgi:hypothetical protein
MGFGIRKKPISDPGSRGFKKAPDPGSGTLLTSYWIRNLPRCVIFGFPPPLAPPSLALASVDAPDPP